MAKLGQALIQTQSQVLKPQQILVSTLLQLPMLLLEQKIKTELELNPVLEETEDWDEAQDDDDEIDDNDAESEEIEEEFKEIEDNNKSEEDKLNDEVQEDFDLEDLLPNEDDDLPQVRQQVDPNQEERDMPEPYVSTMAEHLVEQLYMLDLNEVQFRIAEYLIYNLRDDGYLDSEVTLDMVAQIFDSTEETVEKVLRQVQYLDPPGIAARNLRECLLTQLEARNEPERFALPLRILRDCYDDFSNRRFEKIAAELDITLDDVRAAQDDIGRLNPKPGEGYSDQRLNYIVPDFFVQKVDDELVISLNEYKMPGLRISNTYKRMMRQPKKLDREVRKFLKEKVDSAKWFIKAIRQRQMTMQRTMEAIVERQHEFFEKGPEHIKPMIMKDIAEMIQMDISTVSRVSKGKYVETDHGVFELKYFFNEGMETEDGEDMSTLRIKERLRDIIGAENKKKPLSDEKLAQMLKTEGIPIARRTVAKYREQLDIPVARLRRDI